VSDHVDLGTFVEGVRRRNPGQPEFVQAVQEVAEDIFDFIRDQEQYHQYQILRRIAEPDRVVSFWVVWEDDNHNIRVQRGWRVQNNNSIGPYKGGLRFHPSVTESVLKFLAFEQTSVHFGIWQGRLGSPGGVWPTGAGARPRPRGNSGRAPV
jgi:glutamate dehydrogenase (NADP+)